MDHRSCSTHSQLRSSSDAKRFLQKAQPGNLAGALAASEPLLLSGDRIPA